MQTHQDVYRSQLEGPDVVQQEREMLVRFCARYTGDADAAEDLAQQTLLEALQGEHLLRSPAARPSWLFGIARNQCLLWARGRGRDVQHLETGTGRAESDLESWPAEQADLTLELEREDLAQLLDRAMALLPPETRTALIERYIEESPQAEVANRLGMSEGAVESRLHRGKLALRRILTTNLREEAASLGVVLPDTSGWQQTRTWCPFCARHRLDLRVEGPNATLTYRCSGRCVADGTVVGGSSLGHGSHGLSSPKSILTRELLALDEHYRRALREGGKICSTCGAPVPLEPWPPGGSPHMPEYSRGIQMFCRACGSDDSASLWHLTLDLPATQRFWRRHPRMRALPVARIETEGRPALITGFESVDGGARLELVSALDTYQVVNIHGDTGR